MSKNFVTAVAIAALVLLFGAIAIPFFTQGPQNSSPAEQTVPDSTKRKVDSLQRLLDAEKNHFRQLKEVEAYRKKL